MAGPAKGADTGTESEQPSAIDEAALAEAESAQAETKSRDLNAAAAEPSSAPRMRCPTCKADLVEHGDANPFKVGARHCNGCGACWAPGLKHMRDGHPASTPI